MGSLIDIPTDFDNTAEIGALPPTLAEAQLRRRDELDRVAIGAGFTRLEKKSWISREVRSGGVWSCSGIDFQWSSVEVIDLTLVRYYLLLGKVQVGK